MFHFGAPEDTVAAYFQALVASEGPGVPDVHFDEMTLEQQEFALTYARMICEGASVQGDPDEVVEAAIAMYDELFELLLENSDEFRDAVLSRRHVALNNDPKYYMMAKGLSAD